MEKNEYQELKLRLKNLKKELLEIGPIMRGSVTVLGTKNKQAYFSLNKDKKTKLIYLGKKKEEIGREYSQNHKKLLEIVESMTEVNMLLLKNHHEKLLEN